MFADEAEFISQHPNIGTDFIDFDLFSTQIARNLHALPAVCPTLFRYELPYFTPLRSPTDAERFMSQHAEWGMEKEKRKSLIVPREVSGNEGTDFVANVIKALGECEVRFYPNLTSEMQSCDENGKHNDVIHCKLTAIYNEDNKTDNNNVKTINE
ncbi:hypothetical protein WR25_17420 [Diploscapter pachys]|uniref:Uncharacterized protein n=1 Tax=Diploscapter pachys TaxID=2018661 RepID=A0A2A2KU53_9BILA|nr:hypothetical protein WR25_17420 [Diploscapter pachys]